MGPHHESSLLQKKGGVLLSSLSSRHRGTTFFLQFSPGLQFSLLWLCPPLTRAISYSFFPFHVGEGLVKEKTNTQLFKDNGFLSTSVPVPKNANALSVQRMNIVIPEYKPIHFVTSPHHIVSGG